MKKTRYLFVILLVVCLITGCNDLSAPEYVKTEFKLNESALIDDYEVKLIKTEQSTTYQDHNAMNGQYIILTFQIKNNSKATKNINQSNFNLKINDQAYDIINQSDIDINANSTEEYTIIYDVPVIEEYDILFYSGVVTNNIKFVAKY